MEYPGSVLLKMQRKRKEQLLGWKQKEKWPQVGKKEGRVAAHCSGRRQKRVRPLGKRLRFCFFLPSPGCRLFFVFVAGARVWFFSDGVFHFPRWVFLTAVPL